MTTAKIEPMLMSSTITPKPLVNSAANSIARTTGPRADDASGTSASGAVNTRQPATYTSPAPNLPVSRLHSTDPSMPPTAPAPRTTPTTPGRTCSWRIAYSMNSALNIRLKKLITATPVSAARTIGARAMNRSPAVTPPAPSDDGGSTGWIEASWAAEPRNDSASATMAYGAVSASTSSPPTDGPPMSDSDRLPKISDWPSMYRPGGTIDTNSVLSDTANSTDSVPTANATRYICTSVSACSA
jgi:hypothetical protein